MFVYRLALNDDAKLSQKHIILQNWFAKPVKIALFQKSLVLFHPLNRTKKLKTAFFSCDPILVNRSKGNKKIKGILAILMCIFTSIFPKKPTHYI